MERSDPSPWLGVLLMKAEPAGVELRWGFLLDTTKYEKSLEQRRTTN